MNLFDLAAKITLDSSEFDKGIASAEEKGSSFGSKLKTGLATGAKIGAAAVGAVATGAVALGTALVNETSNLAAYGDNIDKQSQKLGMSAQAYQEWDAVLQHSGTSIDSMSRGMMTLSSKADEGSDAFQRLGISQEEVASMNQEELFARTIEGLQNMGEGTERAALAQDLLGGAAKELGPLLNTSAEDVQAMKDRVHELGGVLSDDSVKAAAAYQDSLQDMQTSISGVKNSIFTEFVPSITGVMDGLTMIFSGDSDGGVAKINEGIGDLIASISERVPEVMSVGGQIVTGLLTAISENLPQLLSSGAQVVLNLLSGVLEALPTLLESGVQVIGELVTGIGQALPTLIPAAIAAVLQLVTSLLDNIDMLIDAAIELIMGLADGIIQAIPILIEKAPEIIIKLVSALIENAPKLIEAGIQLTIKLAQSMIENIPVLIDAAIQLLEGVVGGFLDGLSKAYDAGKSFVENIGSAITSMWGSVKEWGSGVIENIKEGFTSAWSSFISTVSEKFESIKAKVEGPFNTVKETVKGAIDYIKGLFNFNWELPKIKMPHFSVTSGPSVLGINLPRISVSWYKKAYEDPYLFNSPTVMATGAGMKGFGDGSGGELVYGHQNLMQDIREAVGDQEPMQITFNIYQRQGQSSKELAEEIEKQLVRFDRQRKAAALA